MGIIFNNKKQACSEGESIRVSNDVPWHQNKIKYLQMEIIETDAQQLFVESPQMKVSVLDTYKTKLSIQQLNEKKEKQLKSYLQHLIIHPNDSRFIMKCWIISKGIDINKIEDILKTQWNKQNEALQHLYLLFQGIIDSRSYRYAQAKSKFSQSLHLNQGSYPAFHQLIALLKRENKSEQIMTVIQSFIQNQHISKIQNAIYSPCPYQLELFEKPTIYNIAIMYTNSCLYSKSNAILYKYLEAMKELDAQEYQKHYPQVYTLIGLNFFRMCNYFYCQLWTRYIVLKFQHQFIISDVVVPKSFLALAYCKQGLFQDAKKLAFQIEDTMKPQIKSDILLQNLLMIYTALKYAFVTIYTYETYKKQYPEHYKLKWISVDIFALIAYERMGRRHQARMTYKKVDEAIRDSKLPFNLLTTHAIYEYIDFCIKKERFHAAQQALGVAIDLLARISAINNDDFEDYRIKNEVYTQKIRKYAQDQ